MNFFFFRRVGKYLRSTESYEFQTFLNWREKEKVYQKDFFIKKESRKKPPQLKKNFFFKGRQFNMVTKFLFLEIKRKGSIKNSKGFFLKNKNHRKK